MATKITPLGHRVLVKRVDSEEKTAGGIYPPRHRQGKTPGGRSARPRHRGKDDDGKDVIDSSPSRSGDKVLISKYGGTEVKLNGEDVLIISETDILGIVG